MPIRFINKKWFQISVGNGYKRLLQMVEKNRAVKGYGHN